MAGFTKSRTGKIENQVGAMAIIEEFEDTLFRSSESLWMSVAEQVRRAVLSRGF